MAGRQTSTVILRSALIAVTVTTFVICNCFLPFFVSHERAILYRLATAARSNFLLDEVVDNLAGTRITNANITIT